MATPEPVTILADLPKVTPPATSKRSRMSKVKASSSNPYTVTFEGVSNNLAPGSKICIFDNWKVAKGIFRKFIHPVDANRVVGEGNQQRRKDAILRVMQSLSFCL